MKITHVVVITCIVFASLLNAQQNIIVTEQVTSNFIPLTLTTEKGQELKILIFREQLPLITELKVGDCLKLKETPKAE